MKENKIYRSDGIAGPSDGIRMVTYCVRTDFIENPKKGELPFAQRERSDCHISASADIGTFSIRDMQSGTMLTVSLQDVLKVMVAVLDPTKEVDKCSEKTLDNAEVVDRE